MLILRHSKVYGRVYSEARNGRKWREKISFTKNPAPANRIDSMFSSKTYFGTEFRVVVSSAEWFGTEFQVFADFFVPRNLNSKLFSLPGNGSERNSQRLLLILFHDTEFRTFFSSAEQFGTEFREFSVPRNSRNSDGTNQFFRLFRLPRNNFFVGNCQP